jgi:hypothetical protein
MRNTQGMQIANQPPRIFKTEVRIELPLDSEIRVAGLDRMSLLGIPGERLPET